MKNNFAITVIIFQNSSVYIATSSVSVVCLQNIFHSAAKKLNVFSAMNDTKKEVAL